MQVNTIKTTLSFSPKFHQRLRLQAEERNIAMSRIIEDSMDEILAKYERNHLDQLYDAMKKWLGSGSPHIRDASQSIDEALYGENGTWKGQRDK